MRWRAPSPRGSPSRPSAPGGGRGHRTREQRHRAADRTARFPVLKSLDEFQWVWPQKINGAQIQKPFSLGFIATHRATAMWRNRSRPFRRCSTAPRRGGRSHRRRPEHAARRTTAKGPSGGGTPGDLRQNSLDEAGAGFRLGNVERVRAVQFGKGTPQPDAGLVLTPERVFGEGLNAQ